MTNIINAITFLLAGSFIADTSIDIQVSNGTSTLQISNWFTLVISGILILSAFCYLLSVFPAKLFVSIGKKLSRFKLMATAFLFVVTTTQIIVAIFNHLGIPAFLIIYGLFLILLIIAILSTSKQVFVKVESLLTMIFTLASVGIIILLTEDLTNSKLTLLTIFILIFALAVWTSVLFISKRVG